MMLLWGVLVIVAIALICGFLPERKVEMIEPGEVWFAPDGSTWTASHPKAYDREGSWSGWLRPPGGETAERVDATIIGLKGYGFTKYEH